MIQFLVRFAAWFAALVNLAAFKAGQAEQRARQAWADEVARQRALEGRLSSRQPPTVHPSAPTTVGPVIHSLDGNGRPTVRVVLFRDMVGQPCPHGYGQRQIEAPAEIDITPAEEKPQRHDLGDVVGEVFGQAEAVAFAGDERGADWRRSSHEAVGGNSPGSGQTAMQDLSQLALATAQGTRVGNPADLASLVAKSKGEPQPQAGATCVADLSALAAKTADSPVVEKPAPREEPVQRAGNTAFMANPFMAGRTPAAPQFARPTTEQAADPLSAQPGPASDGSTRFLHLVPSPAPSEETTHMVDVANLDNLRKQDAQRRIETADEWPDAEIVGVLNELRGR